MSPVILKTGPLGRKRLRKFLLDQLNSIQTGPNSPETATLKALLRQAADGLIALDYGESQPMFRPDSKQGSKDGTKPYTLRKLRMRALGYADLLIAHKYKGEEAAIRTVAEAYGQKANTFRQWRKNPRLGKTTDPHMKSFRHEISSLPWDQDHVLSTLKKAGEEYLKQDKEAKKPKK